MLKALSADNNQNRYRGGEMSDTLTIHHDRAGHQFETTVDGHRAYLAYMDLGKQTLDIYRTFVPDSLRGRGIAAALTQHALEYAEHEGYTVIPSCSYVERYMERHAKRDNGAGSTQ
jgi:predicted GNAT family acetyltransferase